MCRVDWEEVAETLGYRSTDELFITALVFVGIPLAMIISITLKILYL